MCCLSRSWLVTAVLVLLLTGCGGGSYDGGTSNAGNINGGGGGGGGESTTTEQFFANSVQPSLGFCLTCHVQGGVADTDKGRRFMLSSNSAEDFVNVHASWEMLGKGVETNRILTKSSNTDVEPHSGGAPWPKGGPAYNNMKIVLACWDNPATCTLTGGNTAAPSLALLGNPGKHFFANQICDGKPDSTEIHWEENDPRFLLTQDKGLIDSEQYAVHFNDPFEICHNDTLFETQKKQNELRIAQGKRPVYGAKRYAKTCGELRARVTAGRTWVSMWPTDTRPDGSHDSGNFDSRNSAWEDWGYSERPANYDEQWVERHGGALPIDPVFENGELVDGVYNPYPIPGEEAYLGQQYTVPDDGQTHYPPAATVINNFGGTGRLQLGASQGRDQDGKYNGGSGSNCFACHGGRIGSGEVAGRDGLGDTTRYGANPLGTFMGLPNTNLDGTAATIDGGPGVSIGLFSATRGTFNADVPVEIIGYLRDFDSLDIQKALPFSTPFHSSFGDQRPPSWWWLHNKTRYLWFGGHSTDSSRGNMYFGSINGLTGEQLKENEGVYFEDVHDWTLTVEAPDYPQGYCAGADGLSAPGDKPGCINRQLAEQGAVLFHEKDLWAGDGNDDIPRPKGNGACAGCHGAYSPLYVNDKRFLPDPRLAGMVGYTVPLEIINTDNAQTEGWTAATRSAVSTYWWAYPDAVDGYKLPEEKTIVEEVLDDYLSVPDGYSGENIADYVSRNLNNMGLLQPVADQVSAALAAGLAPVPGVATGAAVGRVKGACSFEEKTIGYTTPPLHGVWASSPYFHNASVPTIWGVLKPSDRPAVWRRQRTVDTDVALHGFEWRLDKGYDFEQVGWKHEALTCGDYGQGVPYYRCTVGQALPPEVVWLQDLATGELTWLSYLDTVQVGASANDLAESRMIFSTYNYGKKNSGHEWTKVLTDQERRALVEYLKTL